MWKVSCICIELHFLYLIKHLSIITDFLNPDGTDSSFNDESLNPEEAIPKKLMPVLISKNNSN